MDGHGAYTMELLIKFFFIIITFIIVTFLFDKWKLNVRNYQGKNVSYSIGCIFLVLIIMDFLSNNLLVITFYDFLLLIWIWLLGFIDDKYGTTYPKGIKGHLEQLRKEGKFSTGLVKAVGVVTVSVVYVLVKGMDDTFWIVALILLIFLPHATNQLDTKPLRVWKVTLLLFVMPTVLFGTTLELVFILLFVYVLWAVYEALNISMLGDNGAMILGAFWAIIAYQHYSLSVQIGLMLFACCITWISERISIQKWVENTPVIRRLDRLGRME